MRRVQIFVVVAFAVGGVSMMMGGVTLAYFSSGYGQSLFEIGEGFLVSVLLFLLLTVIPDRPKINDASLAFLGAASAITCCFVLLVLHMGWYCHALYWGGSWACTNLFNYSQLDWFIMPMRQILPVPPTAEASFAFACVLLGLRFGARATIKRFVIPLMLVYTFVLSLYDPVEMPIQLTSFLAVSYHGIPLLSNRFFLLLSGVTAELTLVGEWPITPWHGRERKKGGENAI